MPKKCRWWEWLSVGVCKEMSKYPKQSLLLVLFDVLFIVSLFAVSSLTNLLLPEAASFHAFFGSYPVSLAVAFLIMILYALVLFLVYSGFKFLVLSVMREMDHSASMIKHGFWKFFVINLIIGLIFGVISVIIGMISALLNPAVLNSFNFVVGLIILLALYCCVMITHAVFSSKAGIFKTIIKSTRIMFVRIHYIRVFLLPLLMLIVFYVLYYLFGTLIIRLNPSAVNSIFIPIATLFFVLLIYSSHYFMRLAFFNLLRK